MLERGPGGRRRADPRAGLEPRARPRALDLAARFAGSTPRSACTRTTRPKVDDARLARRSPRLRRPARRGDRRDRPRLRPGLLADPATSSRTCGGTSSWRSSRASRRSSTAARSAGERDAQDALLRELDGRRVRGHGRRGVRRGRPPARDPLVLRAGRLRRAACSTWGSRSRSAASRSGAGEEPTAEVARLVPEDRLLVETDSPYLSPPGAPQRRNEPEWVRITARWVAERRAVHPDALGEQLVANYDRTLDGQHPHDGEPSRDHDRHEPASTSRAVRSRGGGTHPPHVPAWRRARGAGRHSRPARRQPRPRRAAQARWPAAAARRPGCTRRPAPTGTGPAVERRPRRRVRFGSGSPPRRRQLPRLSVGPATGSGVRSASRTSGA